VPASHQLGAYVCTSTPGVMEMMVMAMAVAMAIEMVMVMVMVLGW
jgi:hypothetical protein